MTEKQRQLLSFIARYQAAHDGVSPSFREMAAGLGDKSISGVKRLMDALEEQGRVRVARHRSRSVAIVPEVADLSRVPSELLLAELGRRSISAGVFK